MMKELLLFLCAGDFRSVKAELAVDPETFAPVLIVTAAKRRNAITQDDKMTGNFFEEKTYKFNMSLSRAYGATINNKTDIEYFNEIEDKIMKGLDQA
jgi:hypothetical protein